MEYRIDKMEGDYETVRYTLQIKGDNTLVVLGCNPSTASDLRPDHTMQNVLKIASSNGYNGVLMINLYPQRTSSPNELSLHLDNNYHRNNLLYIEKAVKDLSKFDIMLAYGGLIKKRPYLKQCLEDIVALLKPYSKSFYCFSMNKNNTPKHPCPRTGLPKDLSLKIYNI